VKPQQYQQLAETEDSHWWHRSRLTLAGRYIARMKLGPHARILDVGCGTGGTTRFLQHHGAVVGIDRSPLSLAHARRKAREASLVQADANRLGALFAPASFDLITFFNVLYHQWMTDDQAIINGAARLLRPGGHLLLTEPAFAAMMRHHDRLDMGKRRYRLSDFRRFFETAGLGYRSGQYFNALAVPACLALALRDRLWSRPAEGEGDDESGPAGEMAVPAAPLNEAVHRYMGIESRVLGALSIPVGVTLIAVARK
jgi:SAM-dependent methyltransferase